jgi:uncharacterized protein YceH (UPF0502 family)
MAVELDPLEARVIGCLIEKAVTTPDQYPLSLNALTNACNQKSNREPVLTLSQESVQDIIDRLTKRYLVSDKSGFGGRVKKYKHRFCNTEFGSLQFSDQELGVVCALLLRGAQTPGELRAHTQRLCSFSDMPDLESTLAALKEHADGPFVLQLPREPGKRESRYMHLFGGDNVDDIASATVPVSHAGRNQSTLSERERLDDLEKLVDELRLEVRQIKERFDE